MSPVGTGNTGTGFALTADGVNLTTGDTRVELALNGSDLVLGVAPVGGTVQSSTSVTIPGIAGTTLCIDGQPPLTGALHMNLGVDGNDVLLNVGDGNVIQTWRQPHIISAIGVHNGNMYTGSTGLSLGVSGNELELITHNASGNQITSVALPIQEPHASAVTHFLPRRNFQGHSGTQSFDWLTTDFENDYFIANSVWDPPVPDASQQWHIHLPPGVWRLRWELQVIECGQGNRVTLCNMRSYLRQVASNNSIFSPVVQRIDMIEKDTIVIERIADTSGQGETFMDVGVDVDWLVPGGSLDLQPCFIAQRIL